MDYAAIGEQIKAQVDELCKALRISEANRAGYEQANRINASLYEAETRKLEEVYRRVFPEEAPWERVVTSPGVSHSPYQWDKMLRRIDELVKEPT